MIVPFFRLTECTPAPQPYVKAGKRLDTRNPDDVVYNPQAVTTSATLPHKRWVHKWTDIPIDVRVGWVAFFEKYIDDFPNPELLIPEVALDNCRSAVQSGLLREHLGKHGKGKAFAKPLFESEANYRYLLKRPDFQEECERENPEYLVAYTNPIVFTGYKAPTSPSVPGSPQSFSAPHSPAEAQAKRSPYSRPPTASYEDPPSSDDSEGHNQTAGGKDEDQTLDDLLKAAGSDGEESKPMSESEPEDMLQEVPSENGSADEDDDQGEDEDQGDISAYEYMQLTSPKNGTQMPSLPSSREAYLMNVDAMNVSPQAIDLTGP